MANFDLDDPLADLLSDGSNDSFFEEPKASGKKLSLTKTPEKKSVSQLFGIEKPEVKAMDKANWLGLEEDNRKNLENQTNFTSPKKLAKKISFEDDNILSTLGLDEKNVSKQSDNADTNPSIYKKSSLVESILKPKASGDKNILFDISKGDKTSQKIGIAKQPEKTTKNLQPNILPVSDIHREGRRGHQVQSGFTDYLGIFSTEKLDDSEKDKKQLTSSPATKRELTGTTIDAPHLSNMQSSETIKTEVLFPPPPNRDMKTKSAPNIGEFPNWLNNGDSSAELQRSNSALPITAGSNIALLPKLETDSPSNENALPQDAQITANVNTSHTENFLLNSLITQQKLATQDIEYQNTTFAVQQQNSQLLMAVQLKKYEENLAVMQRKQQDLLFKQEKQFNSLLERQFTKQQIMENNMKMQQERINSHMQVLLSQSSVDMFEDTDKIKNIKQYSSDENAQLLEELLSFSKQKAQEEKFLLEESYKKQITTLEQTMESVENRLKAEINDLVESYNNKIEYLKIDYEKEILKYKEKIQDISVIQANEIKSIRENHDKIIEEIKYEYSTMIENIKHAKQSENTLFQSSIEYSQKLDTNIKMLDTNTKLLVDVREKVDNDYGILSIARAESLKAKEVEIKLMRDSVEKLRTSAENERCQLLALVRGLEIKLTEQSQGAREERWAMQQAAATLAARSTALDRETEFNRAIIEREREQLKTLKETLLADQETKMLQLTEEKLALSAERSRLETSTKLFQNYDAQKARAEIDAAIEVAQKAAELTDVERKRLHRAQCEFETLKRSLLDREHKLAIKEKELEAMMQIAEKKSKDGEQAIVQANATQRDYNERLKDIQNQLVSLTSREKKLAEEKISLSKERLILQGQMRQLTHPSLHTFGITSQIEQYDYPESV